MKSKFFAFKSKVISLRKSGRTYGEIRKEIGQIIPKSTMSEWCRGVYLNSEQRRTIDERIKENCQKGREVACMVNARRRQEYLNSIVNRNKYLIKIFRNKDVAKIALSMLYLGEGYKKNALRFGNSDSFTISLFLNLLRKCYKIDENKLRCTILCRADQNINKLEMFWQNITNIPSCQFYKTRIDPRTIGKPSKKLDYNGVCVIDYFSTDIFWDLIKIPKVIFGPVA